MVWFDFWEKAFSAYGGPGLDLIWDLPQPEWHQLMCDSHWTPGGRHLEVNRQVRC